MLNIFQVISGTSLSRQSLALVLTTKIKTEEGGSIKLVVPLAMGFFMSMAAACSLA